MLLYVGQAAPQPLSIRHPNPSCPSATQTRARGYEEAGCYNGGGIAIAYGPTQHGYPIERVLRSSGYFRLFPYVPTSLSRYRSPFQLHLLPGSRFTLPFLFQSALPFPFPLNCTFPSLSPSAGVHVAAAHMSQMPVRWAPFGRAAICAASSRCTRCYVGHCFREADGRAIMPTFPHE